MFHRKKLFAFIFPYTTAYLQSMLYAIARLSDWLFVLFVCHMGGSVKNCGKNYAISHYSSPKQWSKPERNMFKSTVLLI